MKKYWENENPIEVDTGKNILRYFPLAGRLQVCMPSWEDKDGEMRQGKTVTLNLEAVYKSNSEDIVHIFYDIAKTLGVQI